MSEMVNLLPCPFCGREKPSLSRFGGLWRVKCVDGCSVVIGDYYERQGAVAAWNRRPQTESIASAKRAISTVLDGLIHEHNPRYWLDDAFVRWERVEADLYAIIDRTVNVYG